MNVSWHRAPTHRVAFYTDHGDARLFVEQTVRSMLAHRIVGDEFQGFVSGVRVGDFNTLATAQDETILASARHVEKAQHAGA